MPASFFSVSWMPSNPLLSSVVACPERKWGRFCNFECNCTSHCSQLSGNCIGRYTWLTFDCQLNITAPSQRPHTVRHHTVTSHWCAHMRMSNDVWVTHVRASWSSIYMEKIHISYLKTDAYFLTQSNNLMSPWHRSNLTQTSWIGHSMS